MDAISQTTLSNAFLWMKMLEFRLNIFSLKFVPKCPINNIPALVQIMAWRRPGDKPLSEPVMVSLLTHICVTRPQWVNTLSCNNCAIMMLCLWEHISSSKQWCPYFFLLLFLMNVIILVKIDCFNQTNTHRDSELHGERTSTVLIARSDLFPATCMGID